jgi:hypothetical protein
MYNRSILLAFIIMTISTDPSKPNWIGLIGESVHTSDYIDIGNIDGMSKDFIVIKRGIVNVHYYYYIL